MTKKILTTVLASVLTVSFLAGAVTGCGSRRTEADRGLGTAQVQQEAAGGVISVKVNPEVAVSYDENGMVTAVEGRNDDGKAVMADYTGYEGKECSLVISEIVAEINEAGYLVEEVEGQGRQITLEIE